MTTQTKPKETDTPEGVMPWLSPAAPLAAEALAALDRPLMAWSDGSEFDSELFYDDYRSEPGGLSPLERKIAKPARHRRIQLHPKGRQFGNRLPMSSFRDDTRHRRPPGPLCDSTSHSMDLERSPKV
ncbi:hypothetical protein ACH4VR_40285 [Streptomyces sp. NPDC020883]|uniref:hypothetical protein n=1 Tax=Streptomyces sp. NPDC020883 TaxID=3365099 RepID=UPI0037AC3478